MPNDRLYLDANATTHPLPEVVNAVQRTLDENWGNPSSQHTEGRQARRCLQQATETAAAFLKISPDWITWTSGGSEAINMWVAGLLPTATNRRNVVVTSAGEHPATLRPLAAFEASGQLRTRTVPVDTLGRVDPESLHETLTAVSSNDLLCVMLIAAHNETGGTQRIEELAAVCRQFEVPFFLDGVQWTAKMPVAMHSWQIDGWAVSFHKFGGPKGIGLLAARPGLLQQALIHGGPQQKKRRGGTENMPGIAGAEAAIRQAETDQASRMRQWRSHMEQLRQGLPEIWPDAEMLHDPERGLPQTILVRFPGWRGDEMTQRLDLEGIAVSTGSACSSGAVQASEAMLGMGMDAETAGQLVRISLPPTVPDDAAQMLLDTLKKIRRD